MLPIYLDIVDEAKRAINKNIWYMFELLESNCAALSYEEIGKKGKWFWNSLFKLTYKRGKDWKIHVSIGILFLVMSILCVIGIVPYIIDMLSNINANNLSKI